MPKEIRINAFALHSPVHHSPGLWRHPEDRTLGYHRLQYWLDLARTLERGLVDAIFMADSIGLNDVYGGSWETAVRYGAQVPKQEPALVVSAMASVTRHLGFGITSNANHESPYVFARRMSTLDNLTDGRVGWNIVTGFASTASRALGQDRVIPHDQRYDIADEYMEVVYKLWEGSWADDAVLRDRDTGEFANPARVRKISHQGEYFQLEGLHLTEPSPQRTPVLFQAGASARGKRFAGRHAECVYLSGPTVAAVAPVAAALRAEAVAQGRRSDDIKLFSMATIITGRTEQEARDKYQDYLRFINPEAAIAMFSGWTGIDFSRYAPDEMIRYMKLDAGISSALENFTIGDPNRIWTVAELARHNAIGGRGPLFIGDPVQVADQIEAWVDATDVDGLNLSYAVSPGAYEDFADFIAPELQARGRYKRDYRAGTLRQKLGGDDALLPERHPGASHRFFSA